MRRILFVVALSIVFGSLFAQDVRYIKLTDWQWEFMTKNEYYSPKNEKSFYLAFQVYNDLEEPNREYAIHYHMIITLVAYDRDVRIPAGGKLLIRTGKDEIISSVNETGESILAYSPENGLRSDIFCHESVPGPIIVSYRIRGKYELQSDYIVKMLNDGVVKIRIETSGGNIDVNLPLEEQLGKGKDKYPGNRFSVSLRSMLECTGAIFNPLRFIQ